MRQPSLAFWYLQRASDVLEAFAESLNPTSSYRRVASPAHVLEELQVLGFDRVGEVLTRSLRVNWMRRPTSEDTIEAIRPAEIVKVRHAFAEPIGAADTIVRYIGKLVTQPCAKLECPKALLVPPRFDLLPRL